MKRVSATLRVMLPLPLGQGYDYRAPDGKPLPVPGTLVAVPLGRRVAEGVVWGPGEGAVDDAKLKPIGEVLPLPPLPHVSLAFVDWVARYTVTPPGAILKMVLGGRLRLMKDKDAAALAAFPRHDPDAHQPALSPDQRAAASHLIGDVRAGRFSATLLDGVTGSGKTEVFCEAIAESLRQGRQVLLLVPEIAMTAALIDRLTRRFGAPPLGWHSDISERQRRLNWHAVARGEARFVMGARSALFLPFSDLGLIVVDEEHEAAYKQEEGVIYHGRDMAVVRARLGQCPVILASATPSLETWTNARHGKYRHVTLPRRYGAAGMPAIQIVDLRAEKLPPQTFISTPLMEKLQNALESGQQSMLFLNRRGYAPLTLCRACGHRMQCPHCTSWLIEHKRSSRLHCHHCGHSVPVPRACPACGAEDRMAACGPGVERIAEEVKARLPAARSVLVASDTVQGPDAAAELVRRVEGGDVDILIGTQMMAKAYHFPRLTLVGVIDADLGLAGGDPRAAERTYHMLQQVAGRSGRAETPGQVLLQTTAPDHPVMQALASGDRDAFFDAETEERETWRLPPFVRLASITVSGAHAPEVISWIGKLASVAPRYDGLRILGPAPAPFAILRGRTRYRLLLRADRTLDLPALVSAWLAALPLPRALRTQVDMDPYSFL